MPRKRQASRTFTRGAETEPWQTAASARWWQDRFGQAIASGELPLVVRLSEIRNMIGFLLAQANTKWPVTFTGGEHAT